jgi:hypothetical protein
MRIPAITLLLLLAGSPAQAGSINLRWNACWGDGGVMNRTFACDTNAGSDLLVGSFVLPQDFPRVLGCQIFVDLAVAGGSLPPWWQVRNAGSCRLGGIGFSPTSPAPSAICTDWSSGQAIGGIASYTVDPFGPGSARLIAATAVATEYAADLFAGLEYSAFRLTLSHAKTVGTGACAGCDLGACIAFKFIRLTTTGLGLQLDLSSSFSDDRLVTWQGGAGVVFEPSRGALNCPLATPARPSTWGAVKGLYR